MGGEIGSKAGNRKGLLPLEYASFKPSYPPIPFREGGIEEGMRKIINLYYLCKKAFTTCGSKCLPDSLWIYSRACRAVHADR